MEDGVERQAAYYARTAHNYAARHEAEKSAHEIALDIIHSLLPALGARSLLDVGAGTGRALRYFASRHPSLEARGVEPVPALVEQAEQLGVPPGTIRIASGASLPFDDESFDVVTSFGVLHHVRQPEAVIAEMLRTARKAVFINDSNRFGQGSAVARYLKLAIHGARLWPLFDWVRTRGKGYMESEGDGVFYSYSVFDSMEQLRRGSKRLMIMETEPSSPVHGAWSTPLSNASTILVGAYK